jgi:hypothetical protein
MDKIDHLMAENNENNKDSQKGAIHIKKIFLKKHPGPVQRRCVSSKLSLYISCNDTMPVA